MGALIFLMTACAGNMDRKQAILDAALACFNEQGIEATSIDSIRARCGASVGSIYHHFGNKEGIAAHLFASAVNGYWDELLTILPQQTEASAAIRTMVTCYVDWVVQHQDLARFLYQARTVVVRSGKGDALRQQAKAHFQALLTQFQPWLEGGQLRQLPIELYAALIIGPAQEYCRAWLSGRTKTSPDALKAWLADAAWRSVGQTA